MSDTSVLASPKALNIQFLPHSIIEQWIFARTIDEMTTVLEEILEIYESFDEEKRRECGRDVVTIIKQTLSNLKVDSLSVTLNALKLLELISALHSQEFLSSLDELFPILLSFMDHPRVALRHHSLRLAGSLVVRLPISSTLKFIFTSLERRPYHPEIPLKCAALALLSVQPTPDNKILTSSTPLIIRILGLCCDYLLTSGESHTGLDPLPTPRGIIVSDSVKDLIAIGTMIFCILSLSQRREEEPVESLEDLFPKKLLGLLGNPLPDVLAEDIYRRGLQSEFPSLASDPYLSELSSIAMENSLHQIDQSLEEPSPSPSPSPSQSHASVLTPAPRSVSISAPPAEKRKTSLPRPSQPPVAVAQTAAPAPVAVASSVPKLLLRERTPLEGSRMQINVSTPDSISSVTEEVYHPSWSASPDISSHPLTIEHTIDGYSTTLDSPWTKIHGTTTTAGGGGGLDEDLRSHTPIDSHVDRTKLTSIKRVGRNSRRVRTANDVPSESAQATEEWPSDLPATANARLVSLGGGASDFGNQDSSLPPTPYQPHPQPSTYRASPSHSHSPSVIFESNPNEETATEAMASHLPPRKRAAKAPRPKIPLDQNTFVSRSEERPALHPPVNPNRDRLFSDDQELPLQEGIATTADSFEYLAVEDIKPCEKPQRELSRIVTDLIQHDWPEIFYTLNVVRQLATHHRTAILQSGQLHSMVLGVNKQIENLRSTAAKNAILAMGDLYCSLRGAMDPEIVSSSAILIKRLSDSSAFITDSVVTSLMLMNQCVSFHRSHAALLNGLDNKNAVIRGQCMRLLLHLYQIRGRDVAAAGSGSGSSELEAILKRLGKTARDTSPEARKFSRGLVKELIEAELVPKAKVIEALGEELVKSSLRVDLSLTSSMTMTMTLATQRKQQQQQLESSGQLLLNQTLGSTLPANPNATANSASLWRPSQGQGQGQSYGLQTQSYGQGQGQQGQSLSPSPSVSVPKLSLPKSTATFSTDNSSGSSGGLSLMVSGVSPRGIGIAQQHRSSQGTVSLTPQPLSKQQQEAIPELAILPSLFHSASVSKNWQERRDSLTSLCDLMIQHQDLFHRANKLEKTLELFLERFEDGSVKVILHAISCVQKIHRHCPSLLSKLLPISLPAVLGVESSANKQISAEGGSLLEVLLKDTHDSPESLSLLAQQLIRIALHEKERIRAAAFRAMTRFIFLSLSSSSGSNLETVLRRNFFPMICQTLCSSSTKPDIKTAAIETLRAVQAAVSPAEYIGNWTDSPQHRDEIKRLL